MLRIILQFASALLLNTSTVSHILARGVRRGGVQIRRQLSAPGCAQRVHDHLAVAFVALNVLLGSVLTYQSSPTRSAGWPAHMFCH